MFPLLRRMLFAPTPLQRRPDADAKTTEPGLSTAHPQPRP